MSDQAQLLDDALQRGGVMSPEVQALVDVAAEVVRSLAAWQLTAAERSAIRARMTEIADRSRTPAWRRLRPRPRTAALIGGATVAAAAAVTIGVALARGRRQQRLQPA